MQDYDDVSITFEDQQKINKFARFNAKLEDIKEELKVKQNDMTSLEEACDELALMDESDGKVPYLIGEVFICQNVDFTLVSTMFFRFLRSWVNIVFNVVKKKS